MFATFSLHVASLFPPSTHEYFFHFSASTFYVSIFLLFFFSVKAPATTKSSLSRYIGKWLCLTWLLCYYTFVCSLSLRTETIAVLRGGIVSTTHPNHRAPSEISKHENTKERSERMKASFSRVHWESGKAKGNISESTLRLRHDNPQQNDIPRKAREREWQTRREEAEKKNRNYFHISITYRVSERSRRRVVSGVFYAVVRSFLGKRGDDWVFYELRERFACLDEDSFEFAWRNPTILIRK